MSKNTKNIALQHLIESIVREVLAEEADSGEDVVLSDPLVKIFIQPFTDVIKTANYEIKKNLTNIRGNAKSFIKQVAILSIPFLSNEMIDDTHKAAQEELGKRLGKLDQEYAEVYKRNWESLRSRDVWGIGFMLNPAQGVAAKFAMKAPLATLNILKTITAGSLSQKNQERLANAMKFAGNFAHNASPNYGSSVSYGGSGYGSGGFDLGYFNGDFSDELGGEAVKTSLPRLFEQEQQQPQKDGKADLKRLVAFIEAFGKQPDVKNAIQNSAFSKELRQAAYDAVMKTAGPVLSASNYDQLLKALGPDGAKYQKEVEKLIPPDLSPEEQDQIKQGLVPEIKNSYKQVLVKQLSNQASDDSVANKNLQQLITQINKA